LTLTENKFTQDNGVSNIECSHQKVSLKKKFLTKLIPKGDTLEVLDYIEVPSYAKRLRISGTDRNLVLEGDNQIGIWKTGFQEIETNFKTEIEDRIFTLF